MLTAADVMTRDVVSVDTEKPVRDIAELLYTRRISGVPVIDANGRVIGIVSEGDLIAHAAIVGEHHRSWWLSLFADESVTAPGLCEGARSDRSRCDDYEGGQHRGDRDPCRDRGDCFTAIASSESQSFAAASSSASSHEAICSRPLATAENASRLGPWTIEPFTTSSCANSREPALGSCLGRPCREWRCSLSMERFRPKTSDERFGLRQRTCRVSNVLKTI